jgi:hypothetical protein
LAVLSRGFLIFAGTLVVAGAVIVIPSFRRARMSGGERPVIGDTRTVISAQAAYAASNGGYFAGHLECLESPASCLPGYTGPTFLDPVLAGARTKAGYERRLVPSLPATAEEIARGKLGKGSVRCYAYLSTPVESTSDARSYCGDCTGVVCWRQGGPPVVKDGECRECQPLH